MHGTRPEPNCRIFRERRIQPRASGYRTEICLLKESFPSWKNDVTENRQTSFSPTPREPRHPGGPSRRPMTIALWRPLRIAKVFRPCACSR
jgi:hypothetical protein